MKQNKRIILIALLGLLSSTVVFADTYLIDVRTPQEYDEGHVAHAHNIPYDTINTDIAALTTDKNDTIYLYCRSGRRAEIARKILWQLGYHHVTNLGRLQDAEAAHIDIKTEQ